MSREVLVILIGFLVFFTPFLGVPQSWKDGLLIAAGVFLMLIGFLLRRAAFLRSIDRGNGERQGELFLESDPHAAQAAPAAEQKERRVS